ncbi:hypothetical protein [Maridesulfovibrio zosterae]|nr:hypothetical protein [Maridesulfovibrio zosterae]
MTGEGVEAIIVMLVIVFAIFRMVKNSGSGLGEYTRQHHDSDKDKTEDKN